MRVFSLLSLGFLLACGSDKIEAGGACEGAGSTEECADGTICTNLSGSDAETTGDTNQCLPLCEDDDDCAEDEGCRGITQTSEKSCQPDDLDG